MTRALPLISILLMAGGLFVLAVVAWSFRAPPPSSAPLYSYELVIQDKAEKFPELGLKRNSDMQIKRYQARIAGVDEPLAEFDVARADTGQPVLLEWRNRLNEPTITLTSTMQEVVTLAEAISKHASNDAVILAWWDTSRRLQLLSDTNFVFTQNMARPVLVPSIWTGRESAIAQMEQDFWKVPADAGAQEKLVEFVDALLSDEFTGTAKLRQLADEHEAYLVLHISDVYKIGAMAPARFSVGFKDFAKTGKLHGMVKRIKAWLKEEGHKAYTVIALSDQVRRVYFLADDASTKTMLARLLPFDTSNPFRSQWPRVVYQHDGYWVYKLPPSKTAATKAESAE